MTLNFYSFSSISEPVFKGMTFTKRFMDIQNVSIVYEVFSYRCVGKAAIELAAGDRDLSLRLGD